MRRCGQIVAWWAACSLWAVVFAQEQPATSPVAAQPGPESDAEVLSFRERLGALRPDNPEAYYRLGEEVADAAADLAGRRLAIRLFVLSFELDRDREGPDQLASAACVALAGMTPADRDRLWLLALSRTLDPRRATPEWLGVTPPRSTDSAAYQIATVVGLIRAGQGAQARTLLNREEVKGAVEAYDRLMMAMGVRGGASGLVREAQRWVCPECQNERVVKKTQTNPPEYGFCTHCSGNPGPKLSQEEVISQLRFEAWLLQGSQRSWAAQVSADHGAPLRDPDPAAVARAFNVDPEAVLWVEGEWTRPAAADEKPQVPEAKPDPAKPEEPPPGS